jgi:hypothetical protein
MTWNNKIKQKIVSEEKKVFHSNVSIRTYGNQICCLLSDYVNNELNVIY